MKELVKKILKLFGYVLYNSKCLPRFVDIIIDLKHYYPDIPIRSIVDVGANIGQTALYFHDGFRTARIFSFEPVLSTYKQLVKTTAAIPEISCYNCALGDSPREARIRVGKNSETNSLRSLSDYSAHGAGTDENVIIRTLDEFSASEGLGSIDLLKTDTEGFDLEVLQGASLCFSCRLISFVLCEVAMDSNNHKQSQFQVIHDFMENQQFALVGFYFSAFPYPKRRGPMRETNALYVRSDLL